MRARVPHDVDLEDKLIYGLSPIRFGYLVIAAVAAFSLWQSAVLPAPLRLLAAILLIGLGSSLAWGRWQGRSADLWLADTAIFVRRNYQVELFVSPRLSGWLGWRPAWANAAAAAVRSVPHSPPVRVHCVQGCEACTDPGLDPWP